MGWVTGYAIRVKRVSTDRSSWVLNGREIMRAENQRVVIGIVHPEFGSMPENVILLRDALEKLVNTTGWPS